ncbi:hypothetical protein [Pseudomonas sp. UFMG81]|uniref:hypothetical protein n=1 Tax=Pseudomonas sp. UFMG81 TaxID=2745936 RepID=UPI00188E2311|nr:hypothetical protein [Pseudomonas sp. UFMG81]
MKKIVPDPPEDLHAKFEHPPGQSLSTAILEGAVPIEEVLMNVCHFMFIAYTDGYHAQALAPEGELSKLQASSLQHLTVAWGQIDALVGALRQVPASSFYRPH